MAINKLSTDAIEPRITPLAPTTAAAATSATTTDVTVTWTANTSGTIPTAYQIVGTATSGVTITQEVAGNRTSATMFGADSDKAYTFAVKSKNKDGLSSTSRNASAVTPPIVYKLALTATSTKNFTVPAGYSKMAAVVYGGGGNGSATTPGKGGGGAGAVVFQDYAITPTQVYTLTVASAGGESKITHPDTTVIASATGGAQGGSGAGTNAGGVGTSQVAVNATITGGTGGGGGTGQFVAGQVGGAGSATSFTLFTGYLLPNPISVALGGGGGGGGAGRGFQLNMPRYGEGTPAAGGGAGGTAAPGGANGAGGAIPASAGGGGGGFTAASGTSGGVGRVVVYVS